MLISFRLQLTPFVICCILYIKNQLTKSKIYTENTKQSNAGTKFINKLSDKDLCRMISGCISRNKFNFHHKISNAVKDIKNWIQNINQFILAVLLFKFTSNKKEIDINCEIFIKSGLQIVKVDQYSKEIEIQLQSTINSKWFQFRLDFFNEEEQKNRRKCNN